MAQSFNNLTRISSQIERELSKLVKKTAFRIEAKAKELAPVDTGLLRNSVTTTVESATKATVGTSIEYAAHQEFGTRHQKGKPFLTPAADEAKKDFERDVREIERSLR